MRVYSVLQWTKKKSQTQILNIHQAVRVACTLVWGPHARTGSSSTAIAWSRARARMAVDPPVCGQNGHGCMHVTSHRHSTCVPRAQHGCISSCARRQQVASGAEEGAPTPTPRWVVLLGQQSRSTQAAVGDDRSVHAPTRSASMHPCQQLARFFPWKMMFAFLAISTSFLTNEYSLGQRKNNIQLDCVSVLSGSKLSC